MKKTQQKNDQMVAKALKKQQKKELEDYWAYLPYQKTLFSNTARDVTLQFTSFMTPPSLQLCQASSFIYTQ